ncbi:MAG TPA: hypothetical protein VF545_09460 [Thermoleophilaceae bacterium]
MEAAGLPAEGATDLPELAAVPWRPRASAHSLRRRGQLWTLTTVAHVVPFVAVAVVLMLLQPLSAPVAVAALAHAWIIPELYAVRGANTIRPKRRALGQAPAEPVAQGFLGDLLGHDERELQRSTGLALERGRLGTWLVGEAGALLLVSGGRRVHCFCVAATDRDLPPSDRIAHLLLALRSDETGFATVANHAFSGAPWRVSRRMDGRGRPALAAARRASATAAGPDSAI